MDIEEMVQNGRKYRVYTSPDEQRGAYIILGPPEGLVDELGLPEPTATQLHNILYDRGIMRYEDACKRNALAGVLQELLMLDSQRLLAKFNEFEKETVSNP